MAKIKIGDEVVLIEPFKVFRLLPDNRLDICDSEGNCISVNPNQVKLKTTNMKQMRKAVESTAKDLLKANNTVTTLEIKLQLRRDYPYFYWDQSTVSKYMDGFAGDGIFQYTDNGTYRTYSLVNQPATKRYGSKRRSTPTIPVNTTVTKGKIVRRGNLITFIQKTPKVEGVFLVSGKFVTVQDIQSQKKSLVGYVSQRPSLTGIQVNGVLIAVQ